MPRLLSGQGVATATALAVPITYALFCLEAVGLSVDVNQDGVRESLSWIGFVWPYLEIIAFVTGWLSIFVTVLAIVVLIRARRQKVVARVLLALAATTAFIVIVPERVGEPYIESAATVAERVRKGSMSQYVLSEKLSIRKEELLAATRAGCGPLSRVMSSPRHSQYVFATNCAASNIHVWIWVRYAQGAPKVVLSENSEYPIM